MSENIMTRDLPKFFRDETVTEWLETNIIPLRKEISTKISLVEKLSELKLWPRRPIHKHKQTT